jgi:NADH dehydrogenase [ubiquinone] 1 alpha subcomplex assembly factor 5
MKAEDSEYYDYLRLESATRLVDRIEDISRSFPHALELGCHRGQVFDLINEKQGLTGTGGVGGVETLIQCDTTPAAVEYSIARASKRDSENVVQNVKSYSLQCDEEFLPFKEKQFDMVLSNMNMHWVNDLPSALKQIKACLKPDGVFLGSMLGGSTLEELRRCFYLADLERKGGYSPHASPFVKASDLAALMQSAQFNLPTVDIDTVKISYPDVFTLMKHLSRMGEGTASFNREFAG